ncbi:MAG: hypothetical protein J6N19_09700 [Clostridium sp.]|nr:hypothetical protein [Clostridium sp.]
MDEIMDLMEIAEERIRQYLPEDYEMDDVSWCDTGFRIPIFCVRTIETSMQGPVDSFSFFLDKDDTDAENMERFNRRLQDFCKGWRDVT